MLAELATSLAAAKPEKALKGHGGGHAATRQKWPTYENVNDLHALRRDAYIAAMGVEHAHNTPATSFEQQYHWEMRCGASHWRNKGFVTAERAMQDAS